MDAISESGTALRDFSAELLDLDEIVVQYGLGAEPVAAAPAPAPASTALTLPAASPPTWRERFQALSQLEQAAVLAVGAALLVAGGWTIGAAFGSKAAAFGAAAAVL